MWMHRRNPIVVQFSEVPLLFCVTNRSELNNYCKAFLALNRELTMFDQQVIRVELKKMNDLLMNQSDSVLKLSVHKPKLKSSVPILC